MPYYFIVGVHPNGSKEYLKILDQTGSDSGGTVQINVELPVTILTEPLCCQHSRVQAETAARYADSVISVGRDWTGCPVCLTPFKKEEE